MQLAAENKVILKCGFNHRHHPAMIKANELIKSGAIGKPITGRALYGICGRENYEKEWRSDVEITAGGQLMEQGIHCIDLLGGLLENLRLFLPMLQRLFSQSLL